MKTRRWEVLSNLVRSRGYTTLVELGIFKSVTLKYLIETCPQLVYYGVDTFEPKDPSFDLPENLKKTDVDTGYRSYSQFPLHEFRNIAESFQRQHPQRVHVITKDTVLASKDFADQSVDMVFIDADHTPEGVEADIRAWAPKIKPGGLLTGHDENMPCIRNVLQQLVPGYSTYDDSVWTIPIEEVKL